MNVIFLVGDYLPRCSAVGNCVHNLAVCLSANHDVTVICLSQSEKDPKMEVIENHTVVRVSTRLRNYRNGVVEKIEATDTPRKIDSVRLNVARTLRALSIMVPRGSCQRDIVAAFLSALDHLSVTPDIIVPTCLPFESVLAATIYKEHNDYVRLVPLLFDQFAESKTLNKPAFMGSVKRKANLRLERRAIKNSNALLNVTWDKHIKNCFSEYEDKFIHIEHPLLVDHALMGKGKHGDDEIIYAGALDPVIRNPAYTISLLMSVLKRMPEVQAKFYVPQNRKFESFFEKSCPISLLPAVPASEVGAILANAGWLLSIGNSTSEQKVSKIYEYMAYGKPIIHIASRENDEIATDISKYPLSCCLFESGDFDQNASCLEAFLRQSFGKIVDFDIAAGLFSEELPETVANTLLEAAEL